MSVTPSTFPLRSTDSPSSVPASPRSVSGGSLGVSHLCSTVLARILGEAKTQRTFFGIAERHRHSGIGDQRDLKVDVPCGPVGVKAQRFANRPVPLTVRRD